MIHRIMGLQTIYRGVHIQKVIIISLREEGASDQKTPRGLCSFSVFRVMVIQVWISLCFFSSEEASWRVGEMSVTKINKSSCNFKSTEHFFFTRFPICDLKVSQLTIEIKDICSKTQIQSHIPVKIKKMLGKGSGTFLLLKKIISLVLDVFKTSLSSITWGSTRLKAFCNLARASTRQETQLYMIISSA